MATERVGRAVLEFFTDSGQFSIDVDKIAQKIADLKKKAGDAGSGFKALGDTLGNTSKAFTDLGGSVGPIGPAISRVQGAISGLASGVATLGPAGAAAAVGLAAVTAGALAVGAIATVAYKSTRAAADLGDELFTLSNKTGLSVEALSKFKFIAKQTDTDLDTITKSVAKLGQNLATGSKDTTAAIKAIGLSVADIRKMKPDEAFGAIITAIGKIPDAGQRAAVGAAIFGKQFREIAQLTQEDMKGLGEQAEDLGLVFSTEFAVAGDRFNDAMGAIGLSVDALQAKLGSEFLPVAITFVEVFGEEFGKALGAAGTAAGGLATTVADVALLVGQALASIVEVGAPVVKWLAQFFAGAFITNLGLIDLFGRVVSAIGGMATILGKFDPTMGAVAASAERTGAALQAFAKSGTVGVVQVTGAISQYADAVEIAAKSTGERLPGAVAKVKAEIAATAQKMREAQDAAGGFGNAVDGLGENQVKAEKAAKAHREELEKLDNWFASKGVLTATGYSNALADIIAKLNLAAREGTPTLQAALKVLAPEFDRVAAAAKASGQDVSVVNGIYRDFLELAGSDDIAASMAAWETANVLTADSLNDILVKLPSVSVAAEETALSATIMTDAFHEFGLKTPQELQKASDAARFAYQQIVATVGEKAPAAIAAHAKMVDAINAQTGRIPSYWQTTIFPRVKDVVEHIQTAVTGSFSQMLLGAKSFKDGFVDIWKSIKAGVLNILAQIADAFINSFLKGILGALTGQKGAFSQAFAGLFGGGGGTGGIGQSLAGTAIKGLLGLGGSAATAGAFGAGTGIGSIAAGTGGVTMVGTGAGGVLVPVTGTGAAAAGGTGAGGGAAAGGGLAAGLAGGAAAAGGGVLLGMLGKQLFGGAGWKAGGFGAGTGAATGALIGSVVPVLGTAIGALVGGLAGLFSGWLGKTQAMKVNDARDKVIGQFGHSGTGEGSGFAVLGGELAKLTGGGDIFHALIKASNFKDFEAAVKRVQAALESTEYATVKVREATEQLTAERDKLTASGESEDAVLRQQAASYSTLFQTIQATGATAPASLEPILAKLVEMGLLVDATGQKVTDLSKTFPAVGEAADKQAVAINVAMVRSQAAIDQINTDDPQAAVAAVRSALEALGTETAPEATSALQNALNQLETGDPQLAVYALRQALEALSAHHAEDEFTTLGKVAEDQAARARAALSTIGRGIPPISLRYRYQQDGPGLPREWPGGTPMDGSAPGIPGTYSLTRERAFSTGGLVAAAMLYAASGSFVPRGTDTVPAMLTPGEYVVPAPVVKRIGSGFFEQLIGGKLTPPPIQAAVQVKVGDALKGVTKLLGALPGTYSFDVQAETGSVLTDLTNQIEDLPRDLPIEVSADGLGAFQGTVAEVLDKLKTLAITPALDRAALSGVTGQLASLEKARKVTVAVTATGLAAVQEAIRALPPERRVAIALRLLGLSEVQAGIATIPTERQTAILLKLFGLTEVLAGIGSIPTSHPVAVPLKTAGLEVVRSEIASLPDRHRITVAFESVGLAAVLADIARIPRSVDVSVNYRDGGTPAPPAPRPPATPGAPRPFPSPMPYPDPGSPLPTPLPYPDPGSPLPNPLPYPGPVIGGGGSGGGSFTIPHHRAGGVFATPHVGMIAEGGRPEIIGDEAFMARALARALAGMSGGFFQSLSRVRMPAIVQTPSIAAESIVRDVPSADTAASRGGDGSGGGVTFTGDLHIAVPPGTANPQAFGAQVADAFFGRLKRGGEHLDLMRQFVQKVRT